jgi:hypothetical protein
MKKEERRMQKATAAAGLHALRDEDTRGAGKEEG